MAGLRSATTLTPAAMDAAEALTTLLLAGGMVGLGLGLRLRDLWPIPVRLLLLAGRTFRRPVRIKNSGDPYATEFIFRLCNIFLKRNERDKK